MDIWDLSLALPPDKLAFFFPLGRDFLELTEHMYSRILPLKSLRMSLRLIVRLDLIKGKDGKYRIWRYEEKTYILDSKFPTPDISCRVSLIFHTRQHDNLPSDIGMIGVSVIPGIATISNLIKAFNGISTGFIGRFLLSRGWLGPWLVNLVLIATASQNTFHIIRSNLTFSSSSCNKPMEPDLLVFWELILPH